MKSTHNLSSVQCIDIIQKVPESVVNSQKLGFLFRRLNTDPEHNAYRSNGAVASDRPLGCSCKNLKGRSPAEV